MWVTITPCTSVISKPALAEPGAQRVERVVGVPPGVDEERALARSRTRTRRRSAAGWGAAPGCSTGRAAPARRAAAAWWRVRSTSSQENARRLYGAAARITRGATDARVDGQGRGRRRRRVGHRRRDRRPARSRGSGGGRRATSTARAPRPSPPRCATPAGGRSAVTVRHRRRRRRWRALVAAAVQEYGGARPPARQRRRPVARDHRAATPTRSTSRSRCSTSTLHVNLRGHLLCTRHAMPHLLERRRWRDRLHQLGRRPHRRAANGRRTGVEGRHQLVGAPRRVAVGPEGDPGERGRAGPRPHARMAETIAPSEFRDYALRVGPLPAARSARRHRGDGRLPDVRRRRVGQRPGAERRRRRQPAALAQQGVAGQVRAGVHRSCCARSPTCRRRW